MAEDVLRQLRRDSSLAVLDVLEKVRDGELVEDLERELGRVVAAVQETKGSGSVVVTVKVRPNGPAAVELVADVRSTVPRAVQATTFYAVDGGGLTQRDPRQPNLPGMEV